MTCAASPSSLEVVRSSHVFECRCRAGHSPSTIANHAVSRLRPLYDGGLAERSLVREAEPYGSRARRRVERVALPLIAPVAELECPSHHQVHRLGRRPRPLEERREVDVADLDRPARRVDAQVRRHADRALRVVDDRVEHRVVAEARVAHPVDVGVELARTGRTAGRSSSGRRHRGGLPRTGQPRGGRRRAARPCSTARPSGRDLGAAAVSSRGRGTQRGARRRASTQSVGGTSTSRP